MKLKRPSERQESLFWGLEYKEKQRLQGSASLLLLRNRRFNDNGNYNYKAAVPAAFWQKKYKSYILVSPESRYRLVYVDSDFYLVLAKSWSLIEVFIRLLEDA